MRHAISLPTRGLELSAEQGASLLELFTTHRLHGFPCLGRGKCGKCKVRFSQTLPVSDDEEKLLTAEEIESGIRLACTVKVDRDLTITELRDTSERDEESLYRQFDLESFLSPVRFGETLGAASMPTPLDEPCLAVDLGTTTVAGALLMPSGQVATLTVPNRQLLLGNDLISRMAYSIHSEDQQMRMQQLALETIDEIVETLATQCQFDPGKISRVNVSCNSVMLHLLLGLDADCLARAPFAPRGRTFRDRTGGELGLRNLQGATLAFTQIISGLVGGDILAGLRYCLSSNSNVFPFIYIDIGTNTEVVLVTEEHSFCSSAPAGPVFEGGELSCGMRAQPGAICKVATTEEGGVVYETIDGDEPLGLCGSGVIDLLAHLVKRRLIDESGCFVDEREEFTVPTLGAAQIRFTQKDVRECQLAKSATYTAISTLLNRAQVEEGEVRRCFIAGHFGSSLDVESARRIGLIPRLGGASVTTLGNASLKGSLLALIQDEASGQVLEGRVTRIANQSDHVSLTNPEFVERFTDNLAF